MNSRYILAVVLFSFCLLNVCHALGAPGSVGKEQKPTEDVINIAYSVKEDAQSRLGYQFSKYEPTSFATQIVNGVNYFIKIDVGDQFIHVRAHRSFAGEVSLHSVQARQTADAPLGYFDCGTC